MPWPDKSEETLHLSPRQPAILSGRSQESLGFCAVLLFTQASGSSSCYDDAVENETTTQLHSACVCVRARVYLNDGVWHRLRFLFCYCHKTESSEELMGIGAGRHSRGV